MKTIVYVAGPYRGKMRANIRVAEEFTAQLWALGYVVICPHLNAAFMDTGDAEPEVFLDGDLEIIKALAAGARGHFIMALLPHWQESKGTLNEVALAKSLDVPVMSVLQLLLP